MQEDLSKPYPADDTGQLASENAGDAWVLHHHPFCPHSRSARLLLAEVGAPVVLQQQKPWDRDEAFLVINPAGKIPVLEIKDQGNVCGVAAICEFLLEYGFEPTNVMRVFPPAWQDRAEMRRLRDWFDVKFGDEVSGAIVEEQVYRRQKTAAMGGGAPNTDILRLAMSNLKTHLMYLDYLLDRSGWLIGEKLSAADLIAAAHISVLDYFGLIRWDNETHTKEWYARVKSRPGFKPLFADRVPGTAPPSYYTLLDF